MTNKDGGVRVVKESFWFDYQSFHRGATVRASHPAIKSCPESFWPEGHVDVEWPEGGKQ
jgi:hypothetical protein